MSVFFQCLFRDPERLHQFFKRELPRLLRGMPIELDDQIIRIVGDLPSSSRELKNSTIGLSQVWPRQSGVFSKNSSDGRASKITSILAIRLSAVGAV